MAVFGEFEDTCLLQCGSFKADRAKPLTPGTHSAQDRAGLCPSACLSLLRGFILSGDQFLTALGHFDKVRLLFTLRVSHNLKKKTLLKCLIQIEDLAVRCHPLECVNIKDVKIASREKDSGCIFSFNANTDHPVQSCENVFKNILTTQKWPVFSKETEAILLGEIHVSKRPSQILGEWLDHFRESSK